MYRFLIKTAFFFTLAGCGQYEEKTDPLLEYDSVKISDFEESDGQEGYSYDYDSNLEQRFTYTQQNISEDTLGLNGSYSVFSPGSFAPTATNLLIYLEPAPSDLYKNILEDFQTTVDLSINKVSSALTIFPSSSVNIIKPFSIAIPLPDKELLSLHNENNLTVLYQIFDFNKIARHEVRYQGFPEFLWSAALIAAKLRGVDLKKIEPYQGIDNLKGRPLQVFHEYKDSRLPIWNMTDLISYFFMHSYKYLFLII